MKTSIVVITVIAVYGTAILLYEQRRQQSIANDGLIDEPAIYHELVGHSVHANGWVEGRSEAVAMRARIAEQIVGVHVVRGQWVTANQPLVSLDSGHFAKERDLAAAMLREAIARRSRIQNGFRDSEIETARQEFLAANARAAGVEKAYLRARSLVEQRAESQQRLDDLEAQVATLRSLAFAAKGRLETLVQPPREDELMQADALVAAARARLELSQIQLDRTRIVAPFESQVLAVHAKVGELAALNDDQALIVLADTRQKRVVAEVDEFDVLNIQLGQRCEISADAAPGVHVHGTIVEIEPRMNPKRIYAHRSGERVDTVSRRVWIDLDAQTELPIGLPVEVSIQIN